MRLSIFVVMALPMLLTEAAQLKPAADRSITDALNALELLSNIYGHDMFQKPNAANTPTYIKDAMGFVLSFMGLFSNGKETDIQKQQRKFLEMEQKLKAIERGLDDLKRLVQWSSSLSAYQDSESRINAISSSFESLLQATSSSQRNTRKTMLESRCNSFYGEDHPTILVQGITGERLIGTSKSLAQAIRDYTRDDRRKVNHFLLGVARLAKRGADIQIACAKLMFPNDPSVAREEQTQQKNDMEKMMREIREVDRKIRDGEYKAFLELLRRQTVLNMPVNKIKEDIREEWKKYIGESNQNIATKVFTFIMNRWYDKRWLVIVHDHRDRNTHWYYNKRTPSSSNVILSERYGNSVIFVASVAMNNNINRQQADAALKYLQDHDHWYCNAEEYVDGMNGRASGAKVYYSAKENSGVAAVGATAQRRLIPTHYEDSSDYCWGTCPAFMGYVFG